MKGSKTVGKTGVKMGLSARGGESMVLSGLGGQFLWFF